jgi:hypothetical protein
LLCSQVIICRYIDVFSSMRVYFFHCDEEQNRRL